MSFRFSSFSSFLSFLKCSRFFASSLEFSFHLIHFPFCLGPKISGRDLLLVEECCNAPSPMRQVSASYLPSLPCHLLACCILPCHHLHVISCHHVHLILHTCSSHASEHFPRCPFCIPALLSPPVVLSTSFRVWGLNISGLDRDLPSVLGLLPVDRLSSFVPFGLRLILQRLTEGPKRPCVYCSPTPLQFGPKPTKLCSII